MFSVVSLTAVGKVGDALDGVVGELELDAFGVEQRDVLLDQRVLRLLEDADEILRAERLQLHADRKAALQLGNQVGGLGDVEGAGRDEQNVVGAHHAVLGVDGRALDDRQDVALHAFAAHVGPVPALAAGDLVDLVQEDDAGLFHALHAIRATCPCR